MSDKPTQISRRRQRRELVRRMARAAVCALVLVADLPFPARAQGPVEAAPAAPSSPASEAPAEANAPDAAATPAVAPASAAPAKGREDLDAVLAKRGTLVLREGTLADWMLAIQKTWQVDIVYDDLALQQEQFTGSLTDTSLKEILDTILPAKNYGYRRQNNAIVIVPLSAMGEMARPNQKLELIDMEFVSPAELEVPLKYLLSPEGKTSPIPSSKTLMVIDYPENIANIREYIQKLDQRAARAIGAAQVPNASGGGTLGPSEPAVAVPVERTVTTVLRPTFVLSESLLEAVTAQVIEGVVTEVKEMNALVVTGPESAVQAAAQIVEKLDVVQKQVRISVIMYDVRVDALEQLGVNWRNAGKGRVSANGVPNTLFDLNSSPLSLGGSAASTGTTGTGGTGGVGAAPAAGSSFITSAAPNVVGSALTLTHLSRHFDLSAVLLALDQTDGARLLARPSVRCYDRRESEIKIISEIPVQQLTETSQGGSIGTTTFREAGVALKVTPYIGTDDYIMLDLAPEFSVLTGFQAGQPIIDRRMQTQRVAVRSGDTLVLGGLRRKNELETVAGIPGLMNLKYVGNLFRSHRTTVEESELITFIQTEIIPIDDCGALREQMAAQVVNETLDQIPPASHSPYVPSCNDPYCPIHNPRPRHHQGNILYPAHSHAVVHDHGYSSTEVRPVVPEHEEVPLPMPPTRTTAPPPPAVRVTPTPAPPATRVPPAPVPVAPSRALEHQPAPVPEATPQKRRGTVPPPVEIDETARARSSPRVVRRLPDVTRGDAKNTSSGTLQRLPRVESPTSTKLR